MKVFKFLIVFGLYLPAAHADLDEKLQMLQQRANAAYEEMMKDKLEAEYLSKDLDFAEKELDAAKRRLADVERETEAARQKSESANNKFEQTAAKWKAASEQLDNAWLESGRQ